MVISWFTENYPPNKGGMARSCDRIINSLRKHHTVNIYHFTNKMKAFETVAQVNGNYTAIPVFEDSAHTLNTLWTFINNNSDITHSKALVAYGSHLCLKGLPLIAKWTKQPLLICFRGNDFDTAIFSQKKQDVLFAIKHATAIACVTKEKVNRIKALQLNNNVFFTPNAINTNHWKVLPSDLDLAKTLTKKINVPQNSLIIGFVGYLKQKKGIDFFINGLKKSTLYKRVHLHFVGDLEPHITWQLNAHNISHSIAKPESQTDLMANYLMCNAIAIPSIYDGMPNVIFEAATLKVPIIASNVGGITDVLNNNNSFIFKSLIESSLINTLNNFYATNTETIQQKSNKLELLIKTKYTPESEISNYLKIIENMHSYEN
ncbi:glycosyltransferase family 4 protein [Seonamhaeicola algicola]|uniref:Glycosyltransferase family 4 protein n=1 Tax=Seonamhaeicola algicola TaxID=1719036 RepID=A0A5C7AVI4_9FLAO|nr:glycosyltransferase family 4 protein [Seonamhaeicola algicola]TXE11599.1 glycosyltransferase family 4 protein [Seonamhaeicola algicola]